MSDSGSSGFKQAVAEVAQVAGEVVKDVADAGMQMAEQGAQSVSGRQPNPQQTQQKQQQDQAELIRVRKHIAVLQGVAQEQKAISAANRRKDEERLNPPQPVHPTEAGPSAAPVSASNKPSDMPPEVLRDQAEFKAGKGSG